MSVISRLQPRPVRKRALNFNPFSPSTVVRRNPASRGRQLLGIAPPQPRLPWAAGRRRRKQSVSGRLGTLASLGKFGSSQVRRSPRQSGRTAAALALIPMGVGAAAMEQRSKRSRKKPALLGLLAAAGLVAVVKRDQVVAAIGQLRRGADSTASPADPPDPASANTGSVEATASPADPAAPASANTGSVEATSNMGT